MKIRIELDSLEIGGEYCLVLRFPYHQELKEIVNTFRFRWDGHYKIWYTKESIIDKKRLIAALQRHAIVEASDLASELDSPVTHDVKARHPVEINEIAQMHMNRFKGMLSNKRYSKSTVETYESLLRKFFAYFYDRDPLDLNMDDLGDFNNNFILSNNYSINTQRQLVSALKLFYNNTENHNMRIEQLVRPRKSRKLPLILEKHEVTAIISCTSNFKHRTILALLYSTGMRISEVLNLRLEDIHSEDNYISIVNAKGRKDRNVPLSPQLLAMLRKYYKRYQPVFYVFEGSSGGKYSTSSVNNIVKRSALKAGIDKKVTCHTFRHSYATHLLDKGINLRYIQELLGHASPKTTEIYTYVRPTFIHKISSPLDDLNGLVLDDGINYNKPKFIPWHSEA